MTIAHQRMPEHRLISLLRLCVDKPAKLALQSLDRKLADGFLLGSIGGVVVRTDSSRSFGQVEVWRLSVQCWRGHVGDLEIDYIEWETAPNVLVQHIREGGW